MFGVEDLRICPVEGEYLLTYSAYSRHGVRIALARTQDPTDLKTYIAKASNYAEGLASATHGAAGTLGALCD